MRRIFFSLIVIFQLTKAETYWVRYGWEIFSNAGDGRSLALGNALTASGGGAIGPLFNPAHDPGKSEFGLTYAHQSRFAGLINSDLGAFSLANSLRWPIGIIVLHEGISNIADTRDLLLDFGEDGQPGTGDAGEGDGILNDGERLDAGSAVSFKHRQLAVMATKNWTAGKLKFGLGIKGLHHSLGENLGTGIGLDLGLLFNMWQGSTLGVKLSDVTSSWVVWDNGSIEASAPQAAVGFYQRITSERFPVSVGLAADLLIDPSGKTPDDDFQILDKAGADFRWGLETIVKEKVSVRLGRNRAKAYTAGLGLKWTHLSIDYAFQTAPAGSALGTSHFISFSVNPEWLLERMKTIF